MTKNSTSFQVHSTHSQPVAAGTVVRFWVDDRTIPNDVLERDYVLEWTITGPYSDDVERITGPRQFDWNTAGRTPAAYDVVCTRIPRLHAGGGAAEPPPPPERVSGVVSPPPLEGIAVRASGVVPPAEPPLPPLPSEQSAEAEPEPGDGDELPPGGVRTPVFRLRVQPAPATGSDGVVPVSLQRTAMIPTIDQVLWVIIRNRTNAISFRNYKRYIDGVMCTDDVRGIASGSTLNYRGTNAYDLLRQATDAFLMQETGVVLYNGDSMSGVPTLDGVEALDDVTRALGDPSRSERLSLEERGRLGRDLDIGEMQRMRRSYYDQLRDEGTLVLPYLRIIRERLADIPLKGPNETVANCYGILRSHIAGPLALELLWSYWHEEGMLVQTLNAILARFQNRRLGDGPDPLARFDLDPLRPLSNLFWGWAQDEMRRLTVRRRAYEYDHEYGLKLLGKAVPEYRTVDSRSKFIESFHNLLYLAHVFFKEDDDTTVIADGFPLLNALRETHLLLAEGAHNQFGDLPSTARAEMLIMQWLLARPEMREFLGGRVMVPYAEDWMDRVDMMKQMQGWTDVSITHFRDMGVYGEQLLLSIRYGNWSVVDDPQQAANWARYWRPELQRYSHAYRAATGVDLTERVDGTLPGKLLKRRLSAARRA